MAWFVAQVWVLCALAFLLGAAVTWLLYVRPLRMQRPEPAPVVAAAGAALTPVEPQPPAQEPAATPALPALAALDTPPPASTRGTGIRASGALDLLGVKPAGAAPVIPTQAGPPDDEAPRP